MSRVVSFSVDNQFADELDNLVQTSGYDNRSRFLRDASLHFAEELQRGSIDSMDEDVEIEGILVVFFQHVLDVRLDLVVGEVLQLVLHVQVLRLAP